MHHDRGKPRRAAVDVIGEAPCAPDLLADAARVIARMRHELRVLVELRRLRRVPHDGIVVMDHVGHHLLPATLASAACSCLATALTSAISFGSDLISSARLS